MKSTLLLLSLFGITFMLAYTLTKNDLKCPYCHVFMSKPHLVTNGNGEILGDCCENCYLKLHEFDGNR